MSITVGICIPKGKKARIRLPERIGDLCIDNNIKIIEVDINKDLDKQGPFDILLHKVLDYYKECDVEEANRKIKRLVTYSARHLDMVVIDNVKWCLELTNRKRMVELIRSCEFVLNGIRVFLPKTVDVTEKSTTQSIMENIRQQNIKYPVISKSYSAYFGDEAHEMAVIFSSDFIGQLKKPCLLQEFSNHGGILYKVFVVGRKFNICERPSIKNLYPHPSITATIHFDSFRVSKNGQSFLEGLHESDPNQRRWRNCDEVKGMLDNDVINEIITRIHNLTGLYLFGFDILIEETTGNYALIDLNEFPSYAGIGETHFPRHLVELLKSF